MQGNPTLDAVLEIAQEGRGGEPLCSHREFSELVKQAKRASQGYPPRFGTGIMPPISSVILVW